MSTPAEIRALLQAEPDAVAAVNCGLQGPIGETRLVAAGGRLRVFSRESIVGAFTESALDASSRTALEIGDFSDTLRFTLADGTDIKLAVSSFERPNVQAVLAAATSTLPANLAATADPVGPLEAAAVPPEAPMAPATPAEHVPAAPAEEEEPDPQAGKSVAVYYSNDIGCGTCLVQTIVFLAPTLGMWLAQDPAMRSIGAAEGSAVDWITEIFAIVGGLYIGYRTLGLVARVSRAGNWQGYVEVKGDIARIVGPCGKWTVVIDGRRPYTVACHMLKKESQVQDKSSTIRPSYNYYLRVEQDGKAALMHSHERPDKAPAAIAGYVFAPVEAEIKDPQSMLLSVSDLRFVTRRLRDLPPPARRNRR